MNTRVSYMYRDGSNYKQYEAAIFVGEITDEQRAMISAGMENAAGPDEDSILPFQIGLEVLYDRFPSHYDDDGMWHELYEIEVVDERPTTEETIADFAKRFDGIEWDETPALAAFDEWVEGSPQGPIGEKEEDD